MLSTLSLRPPLTLVERLTEATPGYETLIVGGEDHKTGQQPHPNPAFDNLEQWAVGERVLHERLAGLDPAGPGPGFLERRLEDCQ